jgi:type I restriction enzyme M protein
MNMPKVSLAKLEEMIVEQEKERQNKLWRLDEIFRGFFSSSEELIDSFCYLAWKAKHCDIDIRDGGLDVFENEDELSRIALYKIRSISRDELAHIIPSVFGILLTSSDEDLTFYCTHAYQDSLSSSGPHSAPDQIMDLICRILNLTPNDTIFDLGSGYGAFLAYAGQYCQEHFGKKLSVCGQEINSDAASYSKMVLSIAGVPYSIETANSLYSYAPEYTKAFVFPPYGLKYGPEFGSNLNTFGKDSLNPRTSSEWMFVLKMAEGLKPGKAAVSLLPAGSMFRSTDQSVREYLLKKHLIDGVISLPAGVLGFSGIATCVLSLKPDSNKVRVLDAGPIIGKVPSRLSDMQIPVDAIFEAFESEKVYCADPLDLIRKESNLHAGTILASNLESQIPDPKKLSEVANVIRGSQYTLAKFQDKLSVKPTKYQILTSSDIEDGLIDYSSLQYIDDTDEKLQKFALKEGDLVVTSKSSKVKMAPILELEGRTIIVTGGMLIVRPKKDKLDPSFLKMFLESESGQAIIRSIQKGITIVSLNAQDLQDILVSCPPIEEQRKLSAKYNSLVATYDGMRKDLQALESQIKSLFDDACKEDK